MSRAEFAAVRAVHGTYAAAWLAAQLNINLATVQLWLRTNPARESVA